MGSTQQDLVQIANVRAISHGLALVCEVDGRRFAVPSYAIATTSAVRRPGDVGTLVIATELAEYLGLVPERVAA